MFAIELQNQCAISDVVVFRRNALDIPKLIHSCVPQRMCHLKQDKGMLFIKFISGIWLNVRANSNND